MNMPCMVVTADVSKLSLLLKADASCRVGKRAHARGAGRGEASGRKKGIEAGRGAAAREAARTRLESIQVEGEARGERTFNIQRMSVTRHVSKFSRRSNFRAFCRVEGRGCDMHEAPGAGRKVRALGARACVCQWGRGGASGAHAKRGRLEVIVGAQGTRGRRAHVEHGAHVRDAGRVEVQRLVELDRALPSRKGGMQG